MTVAMCPEDDAGAECVGGPLCGERVTLPLEATPIDVDGAGAVMQPSPGGFDVAMRGRVLGGYASTFAVGGNYWSWAAV